MDKNEKENKQEFYKITRRKFLKDAGIAAGGVVVGGSVLMAGCNGGETTVTETATTTKTATTTVSEPTTVTKTIGEGEVITETVTKTVGETGDEEPIVTAIRGTASMGFGRDGIPANVDISGGKIVRIRPLHFPDYGYDESNLNPWKYEANGQTLQWTMKTLPGTYGLAYKKRIYSPNRVKYPLKRVDWEPGGDPDKMNPQNRGKSKYKRISWDEAANIVAGEIQRIQEKYGNFAVFAQGDGHGEGKCIHGPHGCMTRLLRELGPDIQNSYTVQIRTPDSWEGWYWGAKHMWGCETLGISQPQTNNTKDLVDNCELLLLWGVDPETTTWPFSGQFASRVLYFLSDVGVPQVYISPELNYAGAVHADKWIPVLPCTDGALALAVAYTWFTEDTYDKEYVETHTVGFDKWKAYVMGDEDGIPKSPEWAAPRCGVPEWTIKGLARNFASKRTSIAGSLGAGMRGTYSHEPTRQIVALYGMQGMGAPGRMNYSVGGGLPGTSRRISMDGSSASRGLEEHGIPSDGMRPHQFIPETLVAEAILNPPVTWWGTGSPWMAATDQFRSFEYPIPEEEGGTEIHMIWTSTPCWTTCWNGGNRYAEALQSPKIECVVTEHPWLENDTLLSDIILPTTTNYEEYDISSDGHGANFTSVWMVRDGVTPVGESKTDYEVSVEVAKAMGAEWGEKVTQGNSIDDWIEIGYTDLNLQTVMPFEEWKEKGFAAVPAQDNWEEYYDQKPGQRGFYEDPEANPLMTPTGLLEYESTALKEQFPDDKERPPVAKWVPGGPADDGWMHNEDPMGSRAEKYPLICQSNHPKWRCHAEHDDITWTREIQTCKVKGIDGYLYEPCWLHPDTAAERGIVNGDIVSVYNERGTVLCGAYVTERLIPGAAYVDHGARVDPIALGPDEWIDRGGVINMICPDNPGIISEHATGQVASGFLVEVEKTDILALKAKYPEAFAREYDPDYGLRYSGWVEGGLD